MRRLVLILVLLLAAEPVRAQEQMRGHVDIAAARFGLPATLIETVIAAESGGQPRAVSPAGAMGLMQLMPGTWTMLRLRLGLGSDPFDPADNVLAGAAYLRELLDRYGAPGFLAAYNAGPGRYEASLEGRPLPLETRLYVDRIVGRLDPSGRADSDWRAMGLFPPAWSQGLGGPVTDAMPATSQAASTRDRQGLFVVRPGQAR
ncbi:lytic transglycosylase domain-containing protein [Caulobacter sp. LjRoot300]|uniref:lytic transglycosylase domain-containing protein n=1 Tax=Caulobacter sp. LjRoot300 TaxID=3342321 RepID=UPI003ED0EE76